MYRNKHGVVKKTLFRLYSRFPAIGNIKRAFFPLRVRSFSRRLARRRAEVRESVANTGISPLFNHVEIETINRCNGECAFCPVNRHMDPRKTTRMTEDLFDAILGQLRDLEYTGELCLFSNNESLIDDRIEEFTARARKLLPDARILLSTNGTLLTPDRFRALIDNTDLFYVNNYCDDFRLKPGHAQIMELAKTRPDWWEKTHIVIRYQQELMSSRGGQAPNRRSRQPAGIGAGCPLPANQLIVRPDGRLSLCCNDALGVMTMGDLMKQTILEAWHSPEFERLRLQILDGRQGIPLCSRCDTLQD